MSLLDSLLGGPKPKRQGPTGQEGALSKIADRLSGRAAQYDRAALSYADTLRAGRAGQRSDLLASASADVAQAAAAGGPLHTNASILERNLNRARGLSRLVQARSNQFDTNLLRERVGFAQGVAQRRGQGYSALQQRAGIAAGLADAAHQRQLSEQASKQNLTGTLIGLATGYAAESRPALKNFFAQRRAQKQMKLGNLVDYSTTTPSVGTGYG